MKTMDSIEDRIERASDIADEKVRLIMRSLKEPMYIEDENGDIRYSDAAQDIFNQAYDEACSTLEDLNT
jgi:hypothetical protein